MLHIETEGPNLQVNILQHIIYFIQRKKWTIQILQNPKKKKLLQLKVTQKGQASLEQNVTRNLLFILKKQKINKAIQEKRQAGIDPTRVKEAKEKHGKWVRAMTEVQRKLGAIQDDNFLNEQLTYIES